MKRLSYAEAAAFLGIPAGSLRSMVSRRQIEHIRLSKRLVVFELDALQRHVDARRVEVAP